MTRESWDQRRAATAVRDNERLEREAEFNATILKRLEAGESPEFVRADMRITRELINRVRRQKRFLNGGGNI